MGTVELLMSAGFKFCNFRYFKKNCWGEIKYFMKKNYRSLGAVVGRIFIDIKCLGIYWLTEITKFNPPGIFVIIQCLVNLDLYDKIAILI